MNTTPATIYLKDYTAPACFMDTAELDISIHAGFTRVASRLIMRRNPADTSGALVLNGEDLQLETLSLDGRELQPGEYSLKDDLLTIPQVPDTFVLDTVVRIEPDHNTQLSGLYRSKDGYFTQCEAQGFRRITFYPDRPDVMAKFSCTLHADKASFPVLLANGNPVASGDEENGRHWARWVDPFPKPAYLFACVAAKLEMLEDFYTTTSGHRVRCAVYVEPGKLDQCDHAMAALKKSMKWDEDVFGLEMDLDHYMIVAVGDFNMGAMENKGLNIFNTKYVLARPDTATDTDYQNIDRVVAHEYFHNWTGNRVTCRDWFQLSLKEGLTVFRDQQFGMDVHSAGVTRIQEVRTLRAAQFPEDAGPMAHPIRPESYAEINNFYTATVYEKGAEVIRMIHTLIGKDAFRHGMDLYFARHDGQAVTCEDFVAAMQDASGLDLTQFKRWYSQAGTPRLIVRSQFDATTNRYTLEVEQQFAPTPYETRMAQDGLELPRGPYHLPIVLGLIDADGGELPLQLTGEASPAGTQRTLQLREAKQVFVFENIAAEPVPSLLRGFSAPVILDYPYTTAQLTHLMAHDRDAVNRWEAGQRLATDILLAGTAAFQQGRGESADWIPQDYVLAMARLLGAAFVDGGDPALVAEALMQPSENVLAEQMEVVDPDAIHAARLGLRRHLARELREAFLSAYLELKEDAPYSPEGVQSGKRALRNACLGYLAELDEPGAQALVIGHFETAGNMTDSIAALGAVANFDIPARHALLDSFYTRWRDEALVVDKWLQVQATSRLPGTTADVRALMTHEAFDIRNPNKVYALVRAFCAANPKHFHAADGSGYKLAADVILQLDPLNPQVASRIARCFDRWKKFDSTRQVQARTQLERIHAQEGLSSDVAEVVGKALS
ncbi:aminopeptidase N [Uliginosibacterium sp. 31-16]|uniref:aminopeptidase N n=1 Tax=Uliginosibacterium sp. 31-16 TaxID=3068315 RepID=UPI00273E379B|nr:aminopeptidase N [Uliginosibacterium sp. 31-16]MDP5241083.1 aminopeptidase N [Uliginosibacterium sp. 31-16]